MGKDTNDLAELVDETIKKVALGLYVNMNYYSYAKYQKPIKILILEEPIHAFDLIKNISSINTARLLFKIIMRALNFDLANIDSIIRFFRKRG
ncbi:hypothetical protein Calag_1269 [Caldisphaera lagunensis DSM 15908]|uniref:Uncharacterized protein n=1 Tax=Caldisphaera lagunensis (strain DSM 15908 / JCM 11604 / ANMR 0165 / IC-154) TaxID=1056495 RepID=L0AD58_CALLD|nr:hypothetical protein [Caldisphaera lagunensis]AFZ70985.1 hypothetical protein Calag_1269 [Caldisphaera lagunensis DSM 15908]